ncbi:hypothetical protein K3N28_10470 [Glycomyces sp. TRM65418]|uniref:hypothetical protein n=1 Tax=Glycomyces sp. TRM65418 TaxID=2867006 RepID=UPI001CE5C14F|nr:hypothetical protein [Glycomyces sp. TRM65418]MCC3763498.1 hypothetical protein [Glycomyces sp. TRM65418]QZD57482.1 hypothetical protein K3N28_10410 [Glycomyces sp. TRM65418]
MSSYLAREALGGGVPTLVAAVVRTAACIALSVTGSPQAPSSPDGSVPGPEDPRGHDAAVRGYPVIPKRKIRRR